MDWGMRMNNTNEWFYPEEKMPELGDKIILSDGIETMEIIYMGPPADIHQSNVVKWRYAE